MSANAFVFKQAPEQKSSPPFGFFLTGSPIDSDKFALDVVVQTNMNVSHAITQIKSVYGDDVTVKPKTLAKFGSNDNIGTTYATVMTLPGTEINETYIATNGITHISSSDAGDDQEVLIEGHTISGSDFTFVSQSVTLNGQNKVALSTPLARATRALNNNGTDLAGDVYIYQDDTLTAGVPDTDTKVHLIIPQGFNQSRKAATAISSSDYYIITGFVASINKKTAATADVQLQVRDFGKVFRTIFNVTVSSTGGPTAVVNLDPAIIIPKNSDLRIRARASTTGVEVSARMKGYLARVRE